MLDRARNSRRSPSILLLLVAVPLCGLLVLGLAYLLYGVVYVSVASMFFADRPTAVPAGFVRNT